MPILLANTNTGTLNPQNNGLLARTHNLLTDILNEHGQIDIFTIQETQQNTPTFPPFFNDIPHNNHNLNIQNARHRYPLYTGTQ